jgi:hypothetical protein
MSASRSTEGEGIDDQKGEFMDSLRKGVQAFISGTACISLIQAKSQQMG